MKTIRIETKAVSLLLNGKNRNNHKIFFMFRIGKNTQKPFFRIAIREDSNSKILVAITTKNHAYDNFEKQW